MNVNNPPKFLLIGLTLISLTVMVLAGKISFGDAAPFYTLIVGYLIGNGIAAARNEPVQPALGARNKESSNA